MKAAVPISPDDEELVDRLRKPGADEPVDQDEPTADAQAVFATPAETPAPRMSEEELVLTLRQRPLEVIDHRATGGAIWVIGNEKAVQAFEECVAASNGKTGFALRVCPIWETLCNTPPPGVAVEAAKPYARGASNISRRKGVRRCASSHCARVWLRDRGSQSEWWRFLGDQEQSGEPVLATRYVTWVHL